MTDTKLPGNSRICLSSSRAELIASIIPKHAWMFLRETHCCQPCSRRSRQEDRYRRLDGTDHRLLDSVPSPHVMGGETAAVAAASTNWRRRWKWPGALLVQAAPASGYLSLVRGSAGGRCHTVPRGSSHALSPAQRCSETSWWFLPVVIWCAGTILVRLDQCGISYPLTSLQPGIEVTPRVAAPR